MRFINKSGKREIDFAIIIAHELLSPNSKMMKELVKKMDFKYNSGTGEEVVRKLLVDGEIEVNTFRPWNIWTKAIGYFDGKRIFINERKLPFMTTIDIASNLIHEGAHFAGFSHGNNYKTEEKCLFSVPYFLSENILKWTLR